jgi:dUTP pyrophosphatase
VINFDAVESGVLARESLRAHIVGDPPLLRDWFDLDLQLQPNGFDLTLAEIKTFNSAGSIGIDSRDRIMPPLDDLEFDADGWLHLQPGIYQILFTETVHLPLELMALGRPRSSLGRCGVTIHTAVWDAGYVGRSTALLSVLNPHGFRIQRHARVLQLVFFSVARPPAEGYRGIYQGENTTR